MVGLGRLTRACLYLGLAGFVVLALWPGHADAAVLVTLLTPMAASLATGIELLVRRHTYSGLSLLAALTAIVLALAIGAEP